MLSLQEQIEGYWIAVAGYDGSGFLLTMFSCNRVGASGDMSIREWKIGTAEEAESYCPFCKRLKAKGINSYCNHELFKYSSRSPSTWQYGVLDRNFMRAYVKALSEIDPSITPKGFFPPSANYNKMDELSAFYGKIQGLNIDALRIIKTKDPIYVFQVLEEESSETTLFGFSCSKEKEAYEMASKNHENQAEI